MHSSTGSSWIGTKWGRMWLGNVLHDIRNTYREDILLYARVISPIKREVDPLVVDLLCRKMNRNSTSSSIFSHHIISSPIAKFLKLTNNTKSGVN